MEQLELQVLEPKQKVGLIVVLTGNGKGKTTSAMGMVLRAVGHGLKVCIIQFMKGGIYAEEIDGFKRLAPNVEFHMMGKGFCGIQGNPLSL
jgi:cob(I)alamin adenosyltransferase